jgi:murein DD-endopeptidase MepM/ murein hydrolase activator NlpD
MRSWFIRYVWDPYRLVYVPVPIGWQSLWRQGRVWVQGALVGVALFVGGFRWWESYVERRERARMAVLEEKIQRLRQEWQLCEGRVEYFYQRQRDFYAPIVGVSPIAAGAWIGGTGGARPMSAADLSLYRANLVREAYEKLHAEMRSRQEALQRYPYMMPVAGMITSGFGFRRDPFHGAWQMHTGVDINARYGTPVQATASGIVIHAGWDNGGGYGIQVEINHLNGFVTKYAHLSRVAVQVGDTVQRGDVIGYVGSTGYSVAPHLHYEVIQNGTKLDPRKFLPL